MLTQEQQVGMFCFIIAVCLIALGLQIWKKQKTNFIPGYKYKAGENTSAYCASVGKGVIFCGIGMFILSIPLSQPRPDRFFALACLVCCLIFLGMGISQYLRAEKLYRP